MSSSKVPSPVVDQVIVEAPPPIEADRVCALSAHTEVSTPALTVAGWLIVNNMLSDTATQVPEGLSVMIVKVTLPVEISPDPGV